MPRKKQRNIKSANNLNSPDKKAEEKTGEAAINIDVLHIKQNRTAKTFLISSSAKTDSDRMNSKVTFSPNVTIHHLSNGRTSINKKYVGRIKGSPSIAMLPSPSKGILKSNSKSYMFEPCTEPYIEVEVESQSQIESFNNEIAPSGDFSDRLTGENECKSTEQQESLNDIHGFTVVQRNSRKKRNKQSKSRNSSRKD